MSDQIAAQAGIIVPTGRYSPEITGEFRKCTSGAIPVSCLFATNDMENSQLDAVKPTVRRDLFVVAMVTLGTYIVSSVLELNERLIGLPRTR